MRVFTLCILSIAGAAGLALLAASCGDKVQSGLTGLDIKVSFESDLPIKRLRFAGFVAETPAFPMDDRPHLGDDRDLDPTDENLIVLLPDAMEQKSVFVRVDGLDEFGAIKASAGASQLVERDKILTIVIHLGMPRICGDQVLHATAEQCDDGDQEPGDGCSGECVIEAGWTCEGTPSVCRTCGDGVCSVGEDQCSCPEPECEGVAMCGDGLCCPGRDENVCSCPEDCLEEGAQTCPDSFCCPDERAAETCEPDCGNCGDDLCERDKGEDRCTCPADCTDDPDPVCGNQVCCETESMASCPQDCCPEGPNDGDGTCCPNESAETSPADCCESMAQCGDSECCPSETGGPCPECCANICGDDICCGTESITTCAQDCCPACGDGACTGCCSGDCPAGDNCDLQCENACSCHFECEGSCDVTCPGGSSCYVECGSEPCVIDCQADITMNDAGVAKIPGAATCYCRGPNCTLNCPPGEDVVPCGDGGIACDFSDCP